MRVWMAPNTPCVRCGGVIDVVDDKLVCSKCGQRWYIGPEGCWGAEFEENKEVFKEHLEDIAKKKGAKRVDKA